MDDQKVLTIRQVQDTFALWKTVKDRIDVLEKAVQLHDASRNVPLSQLKTELSALRLESDRLLTSAQHALLTIKTPRSSNGDSTWA